MHFYFMMWEKKEYRKYLRFAKNEDFICIIKLLNNSVFGEEVLGCGGHATGEDLLI